MEDIASLRKSLAARLSNQLSMDAVATSQSSTPALSPSPQPRKNRPRRRNDEDNFRHRVMQVVSRALLNPIYLDWDIQIYADTPPAKRAKRFPHRVLGCVDKPATIVDSNGIIVIWYLPDILPKKLEAQLFNATALLNNLLDDDSPTSTTSTSWRVSREHYLPPEKCVTVSAGSVNLSAGWFPQGHDASTSPLKPSANFRNFPSTDAWLSEVAASETFISAVLALTHPSLHDDAAAALAALRTYPDTQSVASRWNSVFTGINVIANRWTPSHRDRLSRPWWFDSIVNVGTLTDAYLDFPDIGLRLQYPSRTIVNLCGNVLRHEVPPWVGGERVCLAHFMRRSVLDYLGFGGSGWVKQSDFEALRGDPRFRT